MNITEIAYAVSTTLGDHAGDYDIDAIAEAIQTEHSPIDSIDAIPADQYWAIVERHDTTADEHTALIGTSAGTVTGDHCDVEIVKEVGVGDPAFKADLPVRVDDPDTSVKAPTAADEALTAAGWKRVGDWSEETDGMRAMVVRA